MVTATLAGGSWHWMALGHRVRFPRAMCALVLSISLLGHWFNSQLFEFMYSLFWLKEVGGKNWVSRSHGKKRTWDGFGGRLGKG